MTVDEINRGLAEALELKEWDQDCRFYDFGGGSRMTKNGFSPAEDSNQLRGYVYPEIERRFGSDGISAFYEEVCQLQDSIWQSSTDDTHGAAWDFLTASPAILAAAALKVLEVGK